MNIDKVIFLSMRTWKIMFSWSWRCNKSDQRIRYCMGLHQIINENHKWSEAANQHIITNRRLRLPITKQTINKYCYSSWVGDTSQLSIRFPWQFARTQSYFWLQVQLLAQKHEKIIRRDLGSTFCDPIADLSSIKSRFCLSNVETKSNGNIGKEHRIL